MTKASDRPFTDKEKRNITFFSYLAYLAIKYLLVKTCRYKNVNQTESKPVVYAVWHGCQYALLGLKDKKNVHLLVSYSNDGEIISRASKMLGYSIIRGSKGRGGTQALRGILKTLKKGGDLAYTVDGPRGPIFKVKDGIVKIAQMSQVPIIPLVPVSNKKFTAKSWDKYTVPCPFEKVINLYGDPIYIPRDLSNEDIEKYRLQIENALFELREKGEKMLKGNSD